MGKKRCSNNCERWISVKVGERKVLKKIEHVLLYSLTKMQKTEKLARVLVARVLAR